MKTYTRTYNTPAEAMNAMSLRNTHKAFTAFINKTYYNGEVYTTNTKLDTGDQMVLDCSYCDKSEKFVINYEIIA